MSGSRSSSRLAALLVTTRTFLPLRWRSTSSVVEPAFRNTVSFSEMSEATYLPISVFSFLAVWSLASKISSKPRSEMEMAPPRVRSQQLVHGQRVQVTPDGDLGDAELGRQLVGRDRLALVDHLQDLLVPVVRHRHDGALSDFFRAGSWRYSNKARRWRGRQRIVDGARSGALAAVDGDRGGVGRHRRRAGRAAPGGRRPARGWRPGRWPRSRRSRRLRRWLRCWQNAAAGAPARRPGSG